MPRKTLPNKYCVQYYDFEDLPKGYYSYYLPSSCTGKIFWVGDVKIMRINKGVKIGNIFIDKNITIGAIIAEAQD